MDIEEIVQGFIAYLKSKNQLDNLPKIIDCLKKNIIRQQETALITSANNLNPEEREKIKSFLKKKLGKDFEIEAETDPVLLGGVKIKVGDQVIDLSVDGNLKKLTESLSS